MGKGTSPMGRSSGSEIAVQAKANIKGVEGYKITNKDGDTIEIYFRKSGDTTYYSRSINDIGDATPNGWTKEQMLARVKGNGGSYSRYSKKDLLAQEVKRLKGKSQTEKLLNQSSVRNKSGDLVNKAYRNFKKASRIAKRK